MISDRAATDGEGGGPSACGEALVRDRAPRTQQSTDASRSEVPVNRRTDAVLREQEVRVRTGLSRTTRWRLVRAGRFPAPRRLSDHAVGWLQSDIEAWLEQLPVDRTLPSSRTAP
ncbi:MAG: AlpA family phage regulatory protein [Candidatus Binatia bacterium]